MRVEELVEMLQTLPQTETIVVRIRSNVRHDGLLSPLLTYREAEPISVDHSHGEAFLELSE